MRDTFFTGVYPGLTAEMLDYVLEVFRGFFRGTSPRTSQLQCAAQ
jgi:hypothetical protein